MIRRPPRSTLFPTRRSSDLSKKGPTRSSCAEATVPCAPRARRWRTPTARSQLCLQEPPTYSRPGDRKSTRLNSSHTVISYAVFCLKKKKNSEYKNEGHEESI